MRLDSRLSRVLHVLIHMGNAEQPFTSEALSEMLQTNPVVVRRVLGSLRKAGYVTASKGHGGGWELAKKLSAISFLDIYEALDRPNLFALGLSDNSPRCLIEKSVNKNLEDSLAEAEKIILGRFKKLMLSDIADEFSKTFSMKQHKSVR